MFNSITEILSSLQWLNFHAFSRMLYSKNRLKALPTFISFHFFISLSPRIILSRSILECWSFFPFSQIKKVRHDYIFVDFHLLINAEKLPFDHYFVWPSTVVAASSGNTILSCSKTDITESRRRRKKHSDGIFDVKKKSFCIFFALLPQNSSCTSNSSKSITSTKSIIQLIAHNCKSLFSNLKKS